MHYSKSTGGFYEPSIHGSKIPVDSVEIYPADHANLLAAQSIGKVISANSKGYPVAIDPTKPKRTKGSLIYEVAARRWEVETGGVVVGGIPIKTDRESQAQLFSAYTSLQFGMIDNTPWKAANGSFSLVTLAEIEPVAKAVAAHVRSCFEAEMSHYEAISELHYQGALDSYDVNADWPAWPSQMEIY